jgi:hypothetical protein
MENVLIHEELDKPKIENHNELEHRIFNYIGI